MLGARVIAEFVEPGKSATSTKRPALQRMLTELGELQPDYVIVFDLSRVARDEFDALWLLREITALGCKLESTQERVDDTAEGMLNYTILSGVNAFRSRNDGKKVRLGMQRKHLEGGTLGPAALGYLNVRETIEDRQIASVAVDAQRVPLIRMAFDLAATGQHTVRSVTEILEEAGLRSRATPSRPAKPLNIATVHRMLRNDYYVGIVTHGGIKQPGRHEPLVDQDTFNRVQAVLDSHRACGSRGHKHHHYLSGQLCCGTCGKRYGYGRHRGKMGVHYEYYSCLSRVTPSGPCGACYVGLQLIEDHLDTIHANDWLTAEEREQVRHAVRKYVGDKAQVARSEGERHARRLRDLTTQQQKLVQLYYRDAVSEDVLRAEQARITEEQAQVEVWAQAAAHQVDDVMAALDEALLLVDCHQRAYDHASEPRRRLLNLAIFEHFTIHEEPDHVVLEPQLEAFYEQLMDHADALQANSAVPDADAGTGEAQAEPAALAAATGARNGLGHDANPSPNSWGRGSHSERMAEGEGFEPSKDLRP
jgi:site-specific DNA recombinase